MRVTAVAGLLILAAAGVWWLLAERALPERSEPRAPASLPEIPRTPPAPTPTREVPAKAGVLNVRVVRPDGTGIAALPVVLTERNREVVRVPTDATGWANFADRTERQLSVRLEPGGVTLAVGTFRPADGDLTIEHVLRPPRSLVIRVLCEGERKLPDLYTVAQPRLFDVRTKQGEIHGRFYPRSADHVEVWLQVPGFVDGGARVEADLRTEPALATIHLRKVVALRLRAAGPAGILDHLTLEKRDGTWSAVDASVTLLDNGFAYELPPGLYRVVLNGIRAVVAEVDLRHPFDLAVDLSRAEWLTIHVDVPPGYDPEYVEVLARSGAEEAYLPRQRHLRGCTYAAFVPGDRTFTIRPTHPLLVPVKVLEADRGGTFTLRMRPGPLLRFRIAHPWSSVYTVLYRPDDLEHPAFWGHARELRGHSGTYGLTGWEPGSYAVLVYFRNHVPVLRHVTIPADGTSLGSLPQERGSWVRIDAHGKRPWIRVESLGMPRIRRRERGYSTAFAKGLPAGRYRLRYGAGEKKLEEEIVLDGKTDLTREIDLR